MKPAKVAAKEAASRGGVLSPLYRALARLRSVQDNWIQQRLRKGYEAFLRFALRQRYVTISALVAILTVTIGAIRGEHVPFVLLPHMDSETLMANVTMEVGAPLEETKRATTIIEEAALGLPETKTVYTLLGLQAAGDGTVTPPQSHLGQVLLEITEAEERTRTSDEILEELRARTGDIVGVRKLRFGGIQGGPTGDPIHLEISGPEVDALVTAANEVKAILATYQGVSDIVDDFDAGRREIQIELLESARALGLTTESLATQVRAAFYGFEARKVQRGREDVKIMVRYPLEHRRRIYDVETMRVATPDGTLVPFTEVARLTEDTGFASIKRKNQRRTVTVNADVDDDVTNAEQVIASLEREFPRLLTAYPTIDLEFAGQKLETRKSMSSLKTDFLAALLLIYAILAGLFKSYIEPIIVMVVIPFGLIGAVAGHFVMGYPLTILSMVGLVALTGIVVNDSMILVSFINQRVASGMSVFEAVVDGGKSRLRPILLTSATTVLGIAPLLLERSFQAKFLIPMGISISAGLIFATVLTLVAAPSLYLIVHDVRRLLAIPVPARGPEALTPHAAGS
jgi:multidrug efflux pump subunit AcrB